LARLMIRCPATQSLLYTGATMDETLFERPMSLTGRHITSCAHCHSVHRWGKTDVILEREPPTQEATLLPALRCDSRG
jgi:hypothetical protein